MEVNDIHSVASFDRITLVRTAKRAVLTAMKKRQEDVQQNNEISTTHDEYVMERIVNHFKDVDRTKYLVQWYDNSSADDT